MTDMNTTTTVSRPKVRKAEGIFGIEYIMVLDFAGEPRRYMVRRNRHDASWGWDVYRQDFSRDFHWELVIDQMSTKDYALKVAVADALSGWSILKAVYASSIEWAR